MGDDKWARRKPGSVRGTVVPPPAGDDLPPLPQRRGLLRSRRGRDQRSSDTTASRPAAANAAGSRSRADFSASDSTEFPQNSGNGTSLPNLPELRRQPSPENSQTQRNLRNSARSPGPELPDNVRQLFPPILRSRRVLPAAARAMHPSASNVQSPQVQPVTRQPPTAQDQPPGRNAKNPHDRTHTGWRLPRLHVPGVTGGARDRSTTASERGVPRGHRAGGSMPLAVAWGTESPRPVVVRRILPRSRPLGTRQPSLTGSGGGRRQVLWMVSLMRQSAGDRQGAQQGLAALSGAAAARAAAAQWVSNQVSRSEMIGCDAVMCTDLLKAGVPSSDLLVLRSAVPDPFGADVLVATPILQSKFGTRLRTEYAPAVLASFGQGPARVDVRLVANYGAAAYNLALRRDLAARRTVGSQLIG